MDYTHLIDIAGQAQKHRKQPFVQLVHRWQFVLPFNHLSTLSNHVDHQAVQQLTGCYLTKKEEKRDDADTVFLQTHSSVSLHT